MARRAEFYRDPQAPRANSLRPTAFASVRDGVGALLLVRRADTLVYMNGEVRQQFALCFHALPVSGQPEPDLDETIGAGWFAPADLDAMDIHPTVRLRIDHAIHHPDTVDIG